MRIGKECKREDCFAYTGANRYKNCCTALEEIPEGECPFYKSKGKAKDEKAAMRRRAKDDPSYRVLLEGYGIKFGERGGMRYGKQGDGDSED